MKKRKPIKSVTLEAQGEVARFEELLPQYERALRLLANVSILKPWKKCWVTPAKLWLIAKAVKHDVSAS